MSSGKTHMIIGGVCGLGLARLATATGLVLPEMPGSGYVVPVVFAAISAFLATLADMPDVRCFWRFQPSGNSPGGGFQWAALS